VRDVDEVALVAKQVGEHLTECGVVLDNQQCRCWASLGHPQSLPRHFFEGCKKLVSAFDIWIHLVWAFAARR
jgi:hypothetical protein